MYTGDTTWRPLHVVVAKVLQILIADSSMRDSNKEQVPQNVEKMAENERIC